MALHCPRCRTSNPNAANYCRQCGLSLELGADGVLGAGRARHPDPLPAPDKLAAIEGAANLYFHWEAAGGGVPLLGTEPLMLTVFNGGYNLAEVVLRVRGEGKAGRPLFAVQREIESWVRGQSVQLEIPSWELPDPVHVLHVELVKAEFGSQE